MGKSLLNPFSWFGGGESGAEKQLKRASQYEQQLGLQDLTSAQSGTLPPGQQAWLDRLLANENTRIGSTYANLNIPGSTAQAIDQGAAAANVTKLKYDMLTKLFDQGLSLLGEAGGNYKGIIAQQMADDQATSQALSSLAGAFGGADAGAADTGASLGGGLGTPLAAFGA